MRTFSRWTAPFLLLLAVAVVASGCGDGQATAGASDDASAPAPSARTMQVETLVLSPGPFEDVIELTGSVEALNDATLSAQASGTITRLADRGERVRSGGLVAQIDPTQERAATEQLRAQFELAEDRLERQRPLYRDSIISAIEFEQIRTEYNRAKAALQEAEERLAKTRVETPFAGTVEERFMERGEQASPGMQIARVVNTQRVRVTAGVPERYANDVQRGTPVRLDFRRYGGEVRQAAVTFAGRAINAETRTFPIEVEIDNPDGRLKPEMVARLVVTRSQQDSALVVPRTAVVRDELGTHLYVAVPTDSTVVAEKRDVVLGSRYAERAVVLSGVQRGEQIIVAGQNNLAPGDPVNVATVYQTLDAAGMPYEGQDTPSFPEGAAPGTVSDTTAVPAPKPGSSR